MKRLAKACAEATNSSFDGFMEFFGKCFVRYFTNLGYDISIRSTGRFFTDFLQNVDNIHTQFCFTYPKMKSPSIYLNEIDRNGCVMIYRSERKGFTHYIMGLLRQIATDFFKIKLELTVIENPSTTSAGARNIIIKFRLDYDNNDYIDNKMLQQAPRKSNQLPAVSCFQLLQLFPFGVIINPAMEIIGLGQKLLEIWTKKENLFGSTVDVHFKLRRPKGISFTWNNLLHLRMIMFELELIRSQMMKSEDEVPSSPEPGNKNVLLKGQMKYVSDINVIIFLCSPIINDLDELPELGIYLNDLNQHGLSKEMVLAGWQHNSKLEVLFDKAEYRSIDLEKNYDLLDTWKRRSDELLYSMIPRTVADRLRSGDSPLSTCETFERVTILFCELLNLHSSTVQETLSVVDCMNLAFSCFDALMDKFKVYKVETVGYIYMVAAGAPERTELHARRIADLAICMVEEVSKLKFADRNKVEIRIGIHSGSAVAGIVGVKVPRYCFFGDTINTASRMQSTSTPGSINISIKTKEILSHDRYNFESRGLVKVKVGYYGIIREIDTL
ncbi:hypothetical protein FQA39_LY13279 [Lamprigera yunnana]|nr:hypothetical protein FQA39_LY13279 [Lamprigera yunnana]